MNHDKIKQVCSEVSIAFAHYVDRFDYDKLIDLFTPDGVLDRRGIDLVEGQEAILKTMKARDPKMRTRHFCTNILIEPINEQKAKGITYFTLFRGIEQNPDETLDLDGPSFVGEYHDEFSNTDSGWKIARRNVRLTFQREAV